MVLNIENAGALVAPATGEQNMVSIKILKSTVCGGEKAREGQVVTTTESEARLLLNLGKAEPYVAEVEDVQKKTVKVSTRAKE